MWGWKMGEDLCVEFIIGYFFNDFRRCVAVSSFSRQDTNFTQLFLGQNT